jgi:protein-disulfide isomerase
LSLHNDAHLAAQASLAAHAQGKFWHMHDLLFQNTRTLKRRHLEQYARQLSMDLGQFKAALDNATYKNNVDADMRQGGVVGVSGTPSIYINNKKFSKNLSFENLMQVVNPLLRRAGYPASALPQAPPAVKIDLSTRDGAKGPATAPVTIVEFSDFQCPFCGRATRPIEQIYKAYKGKVRVVFKHFPLNFHKDAHLAAQAALAAGAQGKFWEMHDLLFQNTRTLKRNHLDAYAKKLGLNMSSFKSALDSGTYKAQVDADMAVGRRVGVSGTPTIFVNGRKLMQNISFKAFQSLINPMLLKKGYKRADLPSGPPAK